MCQATEALAYLHSRHVWHRDFKPDNIFLDERLTAYLADTGFAKDAAPYAIGIPKSRSHMLYGSDGFMDPSMVSGRDSSGSALTDGYAVGVTILVCLTNRSPVDIFSECEEDVELQFEDIDAVALADSAAAWPAHAARVAKALVRSTGAGLCHQTRFKRLKLHDALQALAQLLSDEDSEVASTRATSTAPLMPVAAAAPLSPPGQTALSLQVRQMRTGDAHEGLQRNVSNGFDAAMRRLEVMHGTTSGDAPAGFEAQINHWHATSGLSDEARRDLHTLRIWRNASDHHDSGRWRREGPHSDGEVSTVLMRIAAAIDALEGRERVPSNHDVC